MKLLAILSFCLIVVAVYSSGKKGVIYQDRIKGPVASIQIDKVLESTREVKKIKSSGITKGSAQYRTLMVRANKAVVAATKTVGRRNRFVKVVIKKYFKSLKTTDITNKVVKHIEEEF